MATSQNDNMMQNQPTVYSHRSVNQIFKRRNSCTIKPDIQFQLVRNYQGYITMLFILRAVLNKLKFKIGVEIEGARMFDDLVFLREEGEKQISRCLQSKHTTSSTKKIDAMSLLTSEDSEFSIVKYFFCYKDMVGSNFFEGKTQEDLIVYTNCPLDLESTIGPKMITSDPLMSSDQNQNSFIPKKLIDIFQRLSNKDDILDVKKEESCRYKINTELTQILKSKANEYNLTRLARALNDWLLGNKSMQQVEYIVKPYWKFLTEEVINVDKKQLNENFLKLDKEVASNEVQLFHKKMTEEIMRKGRKFQKKDAKYKAEDLTFDNLNRKFKVIEEYPSWELPYEEFNISEVIKKEEIEAFLKLFVLATSQPNLDEIKDIIKQDILRQQQEKYGNDDFHKEDVERYVDEILRHFHSEVFKWTGGEVDRVRNKGKEIKYKTNLNSQEFLEWKAVKFDVRDPVKTFMGRDKELKTLHDRIRRGKTIDEQTNVICGLPGTGKSELVREYIKNHSGRHENKILWINGRSRDSLEKSFLRLVGKLNITTKTSDIKSEYMNKVVLGVYQVLQPSKCLFVFDDALEKEMIDPFMPKESDFKGSLPHVIITSSNSNWETSLKLELTVLTAENAVKLVENQISIKEIQNTTSIKRLVEVLEFFPLAVQQIAVYIEKKQQENSVLTIENLIEKFYEYAEEILKMELPEDENTKHSYEKSTYANFRNIIDDILKKEDIGKNTIDVLGVMSFMAKSNIEINWFSRFFLTSLDEIFQLLNDYSIIIIKSGVINVQSLVQLVTRLMMKQPNSKEAFIGKTLNYPEEQSVIESLRRKLITESLSMEEIFVDKTFKFFKKLYPEGYSMFDFETKRKLIPHLKDFISHVKEMCASSDEEILYLEKLLRMLGACYYEIKEYKEGMLVYKQLHTITEGTCGKNHVETTSILNYLALAEKKLGNYEQAKSLYEKVCKVYFKNYSNDHVKTTESITNLAIIERQLGNYEIAKQYHETCDKTYSKKKRVDPIGAATVLMNLGVAELHLGNYKEAKSSFEKVLKTFSKIYGENHVETSTVLFNLAGAERNLGNYDIAISHYSKIVTVYSEIYGENHVETATVLMNLATTQSDLGNYSDAKTNSEKVFTVYSNNYGQDHIETATALLNLTNVEINLGNFSKAKSDYDKILEVYLKVYGEDHVNTASVRMNLAIAERNLGNPNRAKFLYSQVLAVYTKKYGENHVKTATVLMNSAIAEHHMENYAAAKSDYKKVFEVYKNIYGENHMETARVLMNLANTESKLGNYAEAKSNFKKVYEVYLKSNDKDHPETSAVLLKLADAERNLHNFSMAKSYYEEVIPVLSRNYGEDHLETATALMGLATTEMKLGNHIEAKPHYERVIPEMLRNYGENHLETATAFMGLATTERKLGNDIEAKSHYEKVLEIYSTISYGEDHEETATVRMGLANAERNLGNYSIAKDHYDKVYSVRVAKYGDDHLETAAVLKNLGILEHKNKNYKTATAHYRNALNIYKAHSQHETMTQIYTDLEHIPSVFEPDVNQKKKVKMGHNLMWVMTHRPLERGAPGTLRGRGWGNGGVQREGRRERKGDDAPDGAKSQGEEDEGRKWINRPNYVRKSRDILYFTRTYGNCVVTRQTSDFD
ncbi:uncharacterized protein LOC143920106 [Arctopsyche grandis]|uniref:uncharacterized protein LOC143920106 n=1 Tax=Arctopsyche grandis TaxID=121162 RepID=UPI00406D691C